MSLLRSILTLLLAFSLYHNLQAQNGQVFFKASVLSQPDEFNFVFPEPNSSKSLGFEFNLGYSASIKESIFIWEGQLSYLNAKAESYRDEFIPPSGGSGNDPLIPDKVTFKYLSRMLGVKVGLGYKTGTGGGKHSLTVTAGTAGYFSFFSKTKMKLDDGDWQKQPMYTGDNFKYGILYGFYLKPSYQLKFKRNSPWALNIFGEANLLWRNGAKNGNPLFMGGGGIGVSYSFN